MINNGYNNPEDLLKEPKESISKFTSTQAVNSLANDFFKMAEEQVRLGGLTKTLVEYAQICGDKSLEELAVGMDNIRNATSITFKQLGAIYSEVSQFEQPCVPVNFDRFNDESKFLKAIAEIKSYQVNLNKRLFAIIKNKKTLISNRKALEVEIGVYNEAFETINDLVNSCMIDTKHSFPELYETTSKDLD